MSKRSRNDPGPVPNRWMNCPRKAGSTIADKFIAFKTPLSNNFDEQVPMECRFPPSMLFNLCKSKKIKIGLWIDLTYTSRFYDKKEVEDYGCKYVKLQCRGHGETPSEDQTIIFISVVHTFILNNPLDSIAVHCTHGFNRTGFLIISYLVEKMDFSLDIAVDIFSKARPPGIYKEDYLKELYRRYDDINDTPPPPELPSWCHEEDGRLYENDSGAEGSSSSSSQDEHVAKKRRLNDTPNNKIAFMEGVPGVTFFNEQPKASYLQKTVQRMCKWKTKGFPGSQPVSMDKQNIHFLHQKPYRVSWKADGTRYMMLINGENEIYFFDRDHRVFRVEKLRFPHRKQPRHLKNTLLDGEMVIDKVNGANIPRYLAYDIIHFEDEDVSKMPFYPTRLQYIEYEVIKPRYVAMEQGLINKAAEPFSIRKKDFWHVTQAESLLGEKFAKTLSHEPDGLIFQPSKDPYRAGRCDDVLKWKPIELNSVDFRLRIVKQEGVGIISKKEGHLYVGNADKPFARIKFCKEIKDLHNKIIECKFENNEWTFMRERTDKSFPNSHNTAMSVCNTICDPVTKDYLLNYIKDRRYNDDNEVMPPPPPSSRLRR